MEVKIASSSEAGEDEGPFNEAVLRILNLLHDRGLSGSFAASALISALATVLASAPKEVLHPVLRSIPIVIKRSIDGSSGAEVVECKTIRFSSSGTWRIDESIIKEFTAVVEGDNIVALVKDRESARKIGVFEG